MENLTDNPRVIYSAGPHPDLHGINWPICRVCHKYVDEMEIENVVIPRWDGGIVLGLEYTGEKILHIRCHGWQWSVSNFRGIIAYDKMGEPA